MSDDMVPAPRLPAGARLAARLLDGYTALGGYSLDPDVLWSSAIASEQRDDFGPEAASVRRGLEVYCESIERDARPHGIGRFYLHRRVCDLEPVAVSSAIGPVLVLVLVPRPSIAANERGR